jgi:tryptophanyl-tRNA synthetase
LLHGRFSRYTAFHMRALTGIQPTNTLHIGNLFGALIPAVEMQKTYDLTMMIVDLHAITVPQDPKKLRSNILFLAAAYLAAGIDPEKTTLFQQSQVPAHAELGWLLQTVGRMSELERMTQYKDKATAKKENVSVGLFTYPVLMAADILLHDIDAVPVGEDQKQHMELARDLAERFNRDFGETFVVPKPVIRAEGARILGLDDPMKKMSKSAASAKNYISITDDADTIAKKIRAAVTDSQPGITLSDNRPGLKNLITIMSLASSEPAESIANRFVDKGMKDIKDATADALIAFLTPIQQKMNDYLANEDELIRILADGSARAAVRAEAKIAQAKAAMGLVL